ncbi:MAG: hypothetical protein BGO98_26925 [Myxococcales bacterium 68-20]|nr:MAG: hypothetical protein BGO98_26925 [Myxococcales bacterium 68-20]
MSSSGASPCFSEEFGARALDEAETHLARARRDLPACSGVCYAPRMRRSSCLVAACAVALASCVVYGEADDAGDVPTDAGEQRLADGGTYAEPDARSQADAGDAGADAAVAPLTAGQQAVLDAANAYRAQLSPAPTPPLPRLEWFHEAVPLLEPWSLGCEPAQNRKQVGSATRYTPIPGSVTPQQLVEQLASGYEYGNNACSLPNGNCVVPKALIQRAVTRFACTWNTCSLNGAPHEFWACAFAPEFDVDARPY